MKNFNEFMEAAKNYGIENDMFDVYVTVDGIQCSVRCCFVMDGRDEEYPFQASEELEAMDGGEHWEELYNEYLNAMKAL